MKFVDTVINHFSKSHDSLRDRKEHYVEILEPEFKGTAEFYQVNIIRFVSCPEWSENGFVLITI
jgi:hypothetical protein